MMLDTGYWMLAKGVARAVQALAPRVALLLSIKIEKIERSDTTNLQSSIVNIQFRLVRFGKE